MKLIWTGNPNTVEKKVFSNYSNKNFLEIISEFPKVQKDDGTIEVVTSTVISDELKSIESVVKGSTEMRLAFIQCVTRDGKITDLKQDDFAKLVSMIHKPIQPPSLNSSDDESSEPEESEPKAKRQKMTREQAFSPEECVLIGNLFLKLRFAHNKLREHFDYYNDKVKTFISRFIELVNIRYSDQSDIWISTTSKPNQQLSLETVAVHELQGTCAKVYGVADVGIFNKSTEELFLLAEGKAKEDEDSGCHGIGQLLMAMLTHFVECNGRNSIVGFTLSPSYVSVFDIPSLSGKNQSVLIRLHGHAKHTGGNLKELLVLIPYINLAMQQGHKVFQSDVTAEWIDE